MSYTYQELIGTDLTRDEIKKLDVALDILLKEANSTKKECNYCANNITQILVKGAKYLYNTNAMLEVTKKLECHVIDREAKIAFLETKKQKLMDSASAYTTRTKSICSKCKSETARAIVGWKGAMLLTPGGWWSVL